MFASDNPQPVTHFNLNNLNVEIIGTNDNKKLITYTNSP